MKVQTWEYVQCSLNNRLLTCLQTMAYSRGSKGPGYAQGPVMGHESLEERNEQMESNLKDNISQMRTIAINISKELKDQRTLFNGMDNRLNSASSLITNTVGKVGKLLKSDSNYHIHYLVLFCLLVFFVLSFYIR